MRHEIAARHYASQRPFRLAWHRGRITAFECVAAQAPEDLYLAPALFDPQVNGYAGVDFQQDGLTEDDLLKAGTALRRDGCARFLLTLITDDWRRLRNRLRHLAKVRARCPELAAMIAGWHVEGPFLSATPGFCGAHDPAVMRDPTPEDMADLRRIAGPIPLVVTLAPERAGALGAIRRAVELGIKVSLGHTDARAEVLAAAIRAGATSFTHLGNGCPRELNRHDNILWRVLESAFATESAAHHLCVGLIPDTFHVSPALFRLLHRWLDPEHVYYTTDAMSAAASPPGRHTLGRLTVEVGADQVVRMPGSAHFAGSALRPCEGVQRAARMLDRPWTEAWRRCSVIPGRWTGVPMELRVGAPATFCLVKIAQGSGVTPVRTVLEGMWES